MSVRKQVVFGVQDKELLKVADQQENFSAYVKDLILNNIKGDHLKEMKPINERVLTAPKVYTSKAGLSVRQQENFRVNMLGNI